MALQLWVLNAETVTEDGHTYTRPANMPAGTPWVGGLYEKQGNVRKYLLKTPVSLAGVFGAFGPIDPAEVAAYIEADKGTLRGFRVDEVPSWALGGEA
jgi:hypothetical protein